jgi:hypothetical protein
MPIACKLCIAEKGLHGSEIGALPKDEDELAEHLEREHHLVVRREGESQADADQRCLDAGYMCPSCVAIITDRLHAHERTRGRCAAHLDQGLHERSDECSRFISLAFMRDLGLDGE